MTLHLGTVPASGTLYIPFSTYGGTDGESITLTGLATSDIEIYKNGSTTQRSSDAGFTLLDTDGIDFDGLTGIHGFSIDLSDNTDAGFYAVGGFYWVVVSSVTIDGQPVNFVAATFRIGPAEGVTGYQPVDTAAISGDGGAADALEAIALNAKGTDDKILISDDAQDLSGSLDVRVKDVLAAALAKFFSVDSTSDYASAVAGSVVKEIADNAGGSALTEGGIADAVWDEALAGHAGAGSAGEALAAAGSGADAATIADAVLDEALSGHTTAGTLGKALADVEADTNELQADDTPGALAAIDAKIDTIDDFLDTEVAAILDDTNELQGDLADGGRLDLLIDAIKAKTDNLPAAPAATGDIPTAAANADAVWDEAAAGHTDAGKAGAQLWTDIDAVVAKLPTNYIMGSDDQDDHNAELEDWANGGRLDLILDAIVADSGALADTNLTEPTSGAPSASVSLLEAIAYLYFAFRNKRTVTATLETFYNDAGSAIYKRTLSDDTTTFTAEETAAP